MTTRPKTRDKDAREAAGEDSAPPSVASSGRRVFLIAFAAIMLIQFSWASVVPAFRGIDEHDHAYRAASAAEGHWLPDYRTPADGRGDLIPVPEHIVKAAEPICSSLTYTGPDNCRAVQDLGEGQVLVASAAARYNPVFYWVIGTSARPFEGAAALYVMRAIAAALCAALIAAALVLTNRWSSSAWPTVALVAATTPVVTYSTTVAAPNGVEVASALLLWTSIMGLASKPGPRLERQLLVAAGGAAACLAIVRSLGPLWLVLVLVLGMWLLGRQNCRDLLGRQRTSVLAFVVTSTSAVAFGAGWTLVARPNNPAADEASFPGSAWEQLSTGIPLWVLQSIAAFPLRNQPAPTLVYALVLGLWAALVITGVRVSTIRGPLLFAAAASLLIPIALTLKSYEQIGLAWQGRYGYPLAMGVILLAGLALDRACPPRPRTRALFLLVLATCAIACTLGQLGVRTIVIADEVAPSWQIGPAWLVVVLTLTGYAVLALALWRPAWQPEATRTLLAG